MRDEESKNKIKPNLNVTDSFKQHVLGFMDSKRNVFSPQTVTDGLNAIHSDQADLKGKVIAGFNAKHGGSKNPLGETDITPDPTKGYASFLHLGTMRIWRADGRIDEGRLQKAQAFLVEVYDNKQIVRWSSVLAYLADCLDHDPEEHDTARNTQPTFFKGCPYHAMKSLQAQSLPNTSKKMQAAAARKGWEEVFDRLTSLWLMNDEQADWERCMDWHDFELFFRDTDAVMEKARSGILPVAKPNHSLSTHHAIAASQIVDEPLSTSAVSAMHSDFAGLVFNKSADDLFAATEITGAATCAPSLSPR